MAAASLRYEFDGLNRLVIRDPSDLLQPRQVLDGELIVDRDNRLRYRLRHTSGKAASDGRDILLDGTWKLSPAHRLGVVLHPQAEGARQAVFLNATIVDVKDDALIVSLWRRSDGGVRTSQTLSLSGRWQADARNRLTFLVAKSDGAEDRLVFDGAWSVDRRHQLLYRYEQPQVGRQPSAIHTLRFSGMWDLRPEARLVYRLDGESRSAVEFQTSLQSASLNAREGKIAYQVGIRLSGGRLVRQRVTLFGAWKLNRDLSVSFEMPYTDGRLRALTCKGTYIWSTRHAVSVQLMSRRGEPLGMAVTFSRSFLDDAQLFLRLQRLGGDTEVLGGVQGRF